MRQIWNGGEHKTNVMKFVVKQRLQNDKLYENKWRVHHYRIGFKIQISIDDSRLGSILELFYIYE